jgi:anti-sigma factor RsiW
MNCDEVRDLLHACADNELDVVTSRLVEEHMRDCPSCQNAFLADRAIKKVLANPALRQPASDSTRQRLLASGLFSQPTSAARIDAGSSQSQTPRRLFNWNLLSIAASILILAGVIWFVPGILSHPSAGASDADQVLAMHLRSLQMDSHLIDVQSTDQHTVKPWFDGRLDFAPPVHDLADQGFPLAGGRLDYFHGRAVAALVYHRNKHIINLFIWPGDSGQTTGAMQGYNMIHWSAGGMTLWAVSDVNAADLQKFSDLFQASPPGMEPSK